MTPTSWPTAASVESMCEVAGSWTCSWVRSEAMSDGYPKSSAVLPGAILAYLVDCVMTAYNPLFSTVRGLESTTSKVCEPPGLSRRDEPAGSPGPCCSPSPYLGRQRPFHKYWSGGFRDTGLAGRL